MALDYQMTRLANGEKSAFAEIYKKTQRTVYYIALSVLRERSLAEDAMQSTYLNVLKNAYRYRAGTNAAAWIAKIARNEAINIRKKHGREVSVDERENPAMFGTGQPDDYGLLIDLARRILDEDEFTILMLITASGYRRREIAEILEMPIATVTWKFNCATKKLRESLEENS